MSMIFITGLPGSGKSTVATILSKRFELCVANVGDLLATELTRVGIPFGYRAEIGDVFLRHRSSDSILELIVAAAARGISVFDGVRLLNTCIEARRCLSELSIWNIETPVEHRLERLNRRLQAELGTQGSIERGLRAYSVYDEESIAVRAHADVRINNNSSIDSLAVRVEKSCESLPGATFAARTDGIASSRLGGCHQGCDRARIC